jgi:predicted glycogen debranching enzyme
LSTDTREWLVTDGLGGYAMGSADGIRTRRYHAYLIVAAPHDERRFTLVNELELWVDTPAGAIALSSHRYLPNLIQPDGASRIAGFEAEPWPTWRFDLGNGLTIVQQLFSPRTVARAAVILQWRVI